MKTWDMNTIKILSVVAEVCQLRLFTCSLSPNPNACAITHSLGEEDEVVKPDYMRRATVECFVWLFICLWVC